MSPTQHDPEKVTQTIRSDADERVWVEWFIQTSTTSYVHLRVDGYRGEEEMLILDSVELHQAVRALDQSLDGSDVAPIRNMGAFERVWLESEDSYVTIVVEKVGEIEHMLVLDESEASELRDAVELAKEQIAGVEDDPHV